MDGKRFDELSRRFAIRQTRRSVLGLIGAAAASALTHQTAGAAPKADKPKADKPKKCYGEGSHCTNGKQCCSSVCTNRQCTAGGPVPTCSSATDCPGVDTDCQMRTCIGGICGVDYAPDGFPVIEQIAGDCQRNVCNGGGGIRSVPDDSDPPDDANDCVHGTCIEGKPFQAPHPMGGLCNFNGGVVCDGNGQCVACLPGETIPCYTGPEGTLNVGVCRAGTMTCLEDGSGFGECSGQVHPSSETCNLLDDDCDGQVDEGIAGVGASCTTPLSGVCSQGTLQCQNGVLNCVPNVLVGTRTEICNGLDDDCDGVVDNGACPSPYQCQSSQGTYRCCIVSSDLHRGSCDECCSGFCSDELGSVCA